MLSFQRNFANVLGNPSRQFGDRLARFTERQIPALLLD
jgi:hypothetical protein